MYHPQCGWSSHAHWHLNQQSEQELGNAQVEGAQVEVVPECVQPWGARVWPLQGREKQQERRSGWRRGGEEEAKKEWTEKGKGGEEKTNGQGEREWER